LMVSFLKGAFVGWNIPHHIFEFAPIEFGGGHPIGYLRGFLKIVWPEPNVWLDFREEIGCVLVRVSERAREDRRVRKRERREREQERKREKERERERERKRDR